MMASSLLTQLEQAKNYLEDAQIAFSGAVVALPRPSGCSS